MSNLLAWITLLPLAGAALAMVVPKEEEAVHRAIGLCTALATFFVSLLILPAFDSAQAGFQLEVNHSWVPSLGINFHLGIDGISLWLVLLTTLMVPLTLFSPQAIGLRNIRVREFTAAMLVLETGMLGAFVALDLFVFYVFWEVMLVPMYFIIAIWGGPRKKYASLKFFLFTFIASIPVLIGIFAFYLYGGTFNMIQLIEAAQTGALIPAGSVRAPSRVFR
jgi:NADH-quinone oxidoreductase subunit M